MKRTRTICEQHQLDLKRKYIMEIIISIFIVLMLSICIYKFCDYKETCEQQKLYTEINGIL